MLSISANFINPLSGKDQTYRDYVFAFTDPVTQDHLAFTAFTSDNNAPPIGSIWTFATGFQALYAYWKTTGSADAFSRMASHWAWVKSIWSASQLIQVGVGTPNTGQDDATWAMGMYWQAWDAIGDPAALTAFKALMDATYTRYYDTVTGGGLYYSDTKDKKSSYQAPFALLMYFYYRYSGDTTYRDKAVALKNWASSVVAAASPYTGLYWGDVDLTGTGIGTLGNIQQAGSFTYIAGNMAWAALDALIYADTGTVSYKTSAIATANAIAAYEVINGNQFISDRDAFTNAWAIWYYKQFVGPLVSGTSSDISVTLKNTATSILTNAKGANGLISGNWEGPMNGSWFMNGSLPSSLRVSSQGATIVFAGL